jgi:hypothetical protein
VLIDLDADNGVMGAFLIIAFVVLVGPLSLLFGVDSRKQ